MYDEFGNYVGPPLSDDDEEEESQEEYDETMAEAEERANERLAFIEGAEDPENGVEDDEIGQQVVLHEDKKYYPSAEEVFGEDVEALVEDEDAQPLEEALIKSVAANVWQIQEAQVPDTTVSLDFLGGPHVEPGIGEEH